MNLKMANSDKEFWKKLDKINLKEVMTYFISAVRLQVASSLELRTSKRAEILFGSGSGKEHLFKAELYFKRRNLQLRAMKQWFAIFYEKLDENQKDQINELISQTGITEFLTPARSSTILLLNNSDLSPEDTTKALNQLDNTFEKIKGFKSLDDVYNYSVNLIDASINEDLANLISYFLCITILIVSGYIVVLMAIALANTYQECKDAGNIFAVGICVLANYQKHFDELLEEICPKKN